MSLHVVVMGVSGCGKSTVGRLLASALELPFIEGDELHPPHNVALMKAGTPLTDADRQGWLRAVGAALQQAGQGAVASCSALKRSYRDQLRVAVPSLRLVFLHGDATLLAQRLGSRTDHYMPASLLQSQLDTLEVPAPDEAAITADIAASPEAIADDVRLRLAPAAH